MRPSNPSNLALRPRLQSGLSLVELMVGVAVGLLVTLAVLTTVASMSAQRRTAVGGDNAKDSAQAALYTIESAARLAGNGLFYNGQLMCASINSYYDPDVTANGTSLAPVKIVDGGATGSDKITFTYANPVGPISVSHLVDNMPNTSAVYTVNNRASLAVGDLAIIGVPGSARPCTLFKVTGFVPGGGSCNGITTDCEKIGHDPGVSGQYNPANPNMTWADAPRYGYQNSGAVIGPAIISRMGAFHNDTYEVACDSLISHDANKAASCTTSPRSFTDATPLVNNIVMVQAQYGITATSATDEVVNWVSASGAWAAPAAADIPRIKAIRIAVVSRSPEPALGDVTGLCKNAANIDNNGPCAFQDAETPVIDLSAVSVPGGKTWRNYRYRVYTAIIPLRSVLWSY